MRLVLTLLVRDEADIADDMIGYHLAQGVDFVIATDNRSTDATRSILEKYQRRRRLLVIDELDDDFNQTQWVTRMARLAYTDYAADWVINSDADEFWWPKVGNLKSTLAAIPEEHGVVIADRTNFLPAPNTGEGIEHMIYRWVESVNALGRPLPPKVCHRANPDVIVAMGNHSIEQPSTTSHPGRPIEIFHYPLRAYKQFERKIALGGAALARNREFPHRVVPTWRMLYDLLTDGRLEDYYAQESLDQERLATAIQNGRVVIDRRLGGYLREMRAELLAQGLRR